MERRDFLGKVATGAAIAGLAGAVPAEAQVRNVAAERNSFKAADFGAIGNGVADDTAAIQRAIEEADRIGGATIFLEGTVGRTFKCAGQLNLDDKRGVRLSGNGGPNAGDKSQLLFTGKTGPFISLRSSFAVTLDQLRIAAAGPMTGALVATGHSNTKSDTMYLLVDRCMFLGGVKGPNDLLDLSLCIISTVRSSQFLGGDAGITGGKAYANAIQITETIFARQNTVAIRNAGESWLISGCTFEPLANGRAGGLMMEKGKTAWGLTIIGCWMGDVSAGTWIDLTGGISLGLSMMGNRITTPGTAIRIGKGNQGVMISGNRIEGDICIEFPEPYVFGGAIVGNDLQGRVPIANIGYVVQHFAAGQYTSQNFIGGISNFQTGCFSGDGGTRGSIQLVPQAQPAKPLEGDMWLNDAGLFVKQGGRIRRVVLE